MRDLGCVQSPFSAYLLSIGLESLPVRVRQHCANAKAIAEYLESNEKITWVNYPDLKSSKYNALAAKYLPNGTSGVISFGIKGGREAAVQFMDSLRIATIATHVADARTACSSRKHITVSSAIKQLVNAHKSRLIRYSTGLETPPTSSPLSKERFEIKKKKWRKQSVKVNRLPCR